ncbi:MAG: hypothetical protein IIY77_03880 [Lachnospiraceae bacterium]|nr:hypothetical protein [Lachnospiraceae bacterium]
MYCVKCGVKLQEGTARCPLCNTPVWNPEEVYQEKAYSDRLPEHYNESDIPTAIILTVLLIIACGVVLAVCFGLYHEIRWGGYAALGIALFYIIVVLPMWFRHPKVEFHIPLDHLAVGGYVLYCCMKTGGHWFLSFAFPIIGINCLLFTALITLLKHVEGSRPYIFGGFLILLGGFTMLIEFFEHITFKTPMFTWSIYSFPAIAVSGLFLILAGVIKPLRMALRRKFFY